MCTSQVTMNDLVDIMELEEVDDVYFDRWLLEDRMNPFRVYGESSSTAEHQGCNFEFRVFHECCWLIGIHKSHPPPLVAAEQQHGDVQCHHHPSAGQILQ